jgi:hypothetical protein
MFCGFIFVSLAANKRDSSVTRQGRVKGPFEEDKEPSGSIK